MSSRTFFSGRGRPTYPVSTYIVGDASRFFGAHWEVTLGTRVYLPQRLNVLEAFREESRIHASVKLHY